MEIKQMCPVEAKLSQFYLEQVRVGFSKDPPDGLTLWVYFYSFQSWYLGQPTTPAGHLVPFLMFPYPLLTLDALWQELLSPLLSPKCITIITKQNRGRSGRKR